MDIREKLMRLVCDALEDGCVGHCTYPHCLRVQSTADTLLANGVMFQRYAHWKDVMNFGSFCYAYCSNCCTEHKAPNYAALVVQHKFCRWCGARMVYQPPKGE